MKKLIFSVAIFCATSIGVVFGQVDKRVVLIGSDGLSAEVIREHRELFPNINKLFSEGSWSLTSRSVLPSSSAVNWASHLMGAGPELHGYNTWGSEKPDLPSRVVTKNGTFPCIVYAVRERYPQDEIGVVYSWKTIDCLFDTLSASYYQFVESDREVTDKAIEYLKKNPRFAFFYLAEPDHSGHTSGWRSEEYKRSCSQIDSYVGEIVEAIRANLKDVTIIFVSDHGGIEKGHGGITMSEMEVPFAIVGDEIKKGHQIESSMMVFDTAPTIAKILDCKIPQVWIGRPVNEVFEPRESVIVDKGKTFKITVDENPTTGYLWGVKFFSRGLESLGSTYVSGKSAKGMVGVGGKRTFLFKATGSGQGEIVLEHKRPWEDAGASKMVYDVVMVKK